MQTFCNWVYIEVGIWLCNFGNSTESFCIPTEDNAFW